VAVSPILAAFRRAEETTKAVNHLRPALGNPRALVEIFRAPLTPEVHDLAPWYVPRWRYIQTKPGSFSTPYVAALNGDTGPLAEHWSRALNDEERAEAVRFLESVDAIATVPPVYRWPLVSATEREQRDRIAALMEIAEPDQLQMLASAILEEQSSDSLSILFADLMRRYRDDATAKEFETLLCSPPASSERYRALTIFSQPLKRKRGKNFNPVYRHHGLTADRLAAFEEASRNRARTYARSPSVEARIYGPTRTASENPHLESNYTPNKGD